jgi:nucleotide-binding universal stress UspA family protein
MFQSVTVGLDGTDESLAAVDWAAREALARGVQLRIVQVREAGAYPYSPLVDDEVEREWAQQITGDALDDLNRRMPELAATVDMVAGKPAHVLADMSAETDLLVLGSRGLSAVVGFFVGSTALPAVAHTVCPVVLVRAVGKETEEPGEEAPPGRPPCEDVVLGLELDRPCDELIAFAFDIAARHSVPLRALHAWELPPSYGMRPLPVPPAMTDELLAAQNESLAAALRPWQEARPEVKVEAEAVIGHPSRLLVEAVGDRSLLVVGRRNRRSRLGTHLGTITHAVLHHARTPVAVVPHN